MKNLINNQKVLKNFTRVISMDCVAAGRAVKLCRFFFMENIKVANQQAG